MANMNRRNTGYSRAHASHRGSNGGSPEQLRQSSRNGRSYSRSDADARYSRSANGARYTGRMQKQRRRRKILRNVLIAVLAVLVIGAGAAWAYVNKINANLSAGLDAGLKNVLVQTNLTKEPFYMVLLGTDESVARDQNGDTDGTYRTDTIILMRVDPVSKHVTLVSMPRDTQVNLGTQYGLQKLNAAYAFGGSSLAVSTISGVAGVDISHFALVDFDGFKEVVDSLGGIQVDVPMTIDDEDAGGHLDAGLQTLNGDQALILCRARHAYDDYGAGDDYRAANQRLVLQGIANKILSCDVATITNSVTTLSKYVSTDLTVNDIIGLAQALQGMDTQNNIWSAAMPTESVYENSIWWEKTQTTEWAAMMKRVNAGESPTEKSKVDPLTGTILSNAGDGTSSSDSSTSKAGNIVVRNGTGTAGVAQTVANKLTSAGYTVSDTGNADSFNYTKTLVIYNDTSQAAEASAIASSIDSNAIAQTNDGTYSLTGDFLVVIGSNYSG